MAHQPTRFATAQESKPSPSPGIRITDGKLKILGVSSAKRSLAAPNVPTVAEQSGIRSFDLTNWVGVFAPRGTPADVVRRLNREINQVLAQPDVVEQLVRHGAEAAPMSVDQFAAFLKSETSKYEELLRDITQQIGVRRKLISMPFPLWRVLAAVSEHLPVAGLTRNQVDLMEHDNVAAGQLPGFDSLGIRPTSIEQTIAELEADGVNARRREPK